MSVRSDVKSAAKGTVHSSLVAGVGALLVFCLIKLWEKAKK